MSRITSLEELKQSSIRRYEETDTGEVKTIHTIDIRQKLPTGKIRGSVVVIDENGTSDEIDAQELHNQLAIGGVKPLRESHHETDLSSVDSFENTPAGSA
jgi:hypothetical protein